MLEARLASQQRRTKLVCNLAALLGIALLSSTAPISAGAAEPLPRIGVRPGNPSAEFYVVATGARFTPDGFSYTVLDPIAGRPNNPNRPTNAHVTFDPGFYNPSAIDAALAGIAGSGFNVIRVILDSGDSVHQARGVYGVAGPADSQGLYQPTLANFIDFLRRARAHHVYVIVATHSYPQNRGFKDIVQQGALPHVAGTSQYYFSPGGIRAKAEYERDVVSAVAAADRGSLLSTVLAWEIQVEMFVSDETEPFSLHSGTVQTADGKTYDMGNPQSRQECMDSNLINWANTVSAAIHSVDPQALTTAGFATYNAVHKAGPNGLIRAPGDNDQRYVPRPLVFTRARAISFVDVHAYPKRNPNYNLASDLDSNEFSQWDLRNVPAILGEYGANKRQFPDLGAAAAAARRQQEVALRLGIAGTLYWTWNTAQEEWWSATEAGDGVLHTLVRPQ